MKNMIDSIHFDDLVKLDPLEVCKRTQCRYLPGEGYTLAMWGENYRVAPQAATIHKIEPEPTPEHGYLGLFLLHYLLGTEAIELDAEWISEKEIPGGATFFRGPHELPTHLITKRFNNDLEAFGQRCEALHGSPLEMADAAFRFEIVPQVPVAALYWCGDEDFPPEAKLLFDKGIGRYLAADVVFALAVGICERLGR